MWPAPLKIGDTIALVSPSHVAVREEYQKLIAGMEAKGFRVKEAPNLYKHAYGYSASEEERAEDFNRMVADEEVKMIFFGGGYGENEILPLIDFEAVKKTKQDNTKNEVKEAEYANVRIDRKNVRTILNSIIAGMEKTFNEVFIKYSGKISPKFIGDAIYGMYNPDDDTSLQKIFGLFNNHTLFEVVNDLFNEHFLHVCQNILITTELMKALDQRAIEELVENINCLDYSELDKIYNNDTETIAEYRKKLGIDVLIDKHLKKTYKVKGTITQRYIVEVQASNWQEAKKKAMEDLSEPILPTNCNFVESIIELKNWK